MDSRCFSRVIREEFALLKMKITYTAIKRKRQKY